jgi:hypothetical protein
MSDRKFRATNFRVLFPSAGGWGLTWRVGRLRCMRRGFPTLEAAKLERENLRNPRVQQGPKRTHRDLREVGERWARRPIRESRPSQEMQP